MQVVFENAIIFEYDKYKLLFLHSLYRDVLKEKNCVLPTFYMNLYGKPINLMTFKMQYIS
jgi:hypothetical protein